MKSFGEQANLIIYLICFLLSCVIVKYLKNCQNWSIFAMLVYFYLLDFGTRFSTSLKYLFWRMKQQCGSGSTFNDLMSFLKVPLFTLILCNLRHTGYCKGYQNCFVILIKI